MDYEITSQIFELYPNFYRGIVVANNIDNSSIALPELEEMFNTKIIEVAKSDKISLDDSKIQVWFDTYKRFGVKQLKRVSPSIATLIRRIKKGNEINFISPVVCISNFVSLSYLLPVGCFDVKTISGDLILGMAQGNEHYVRLGEEYPCPPFPGEVILYDNTSKNVVCGSWNSRAGRDAIISKDTSFVVIDVDAILSSISREVVQEAVWLTSELIQKYCGGNITVDYLDKEHPKITIPFTR